VTKRILLCEISDVPEGRPHQVCAPERDDALALYKVDGELYLTDDLCTHGLVSLSGGELEGKIIHCPLHGGAFDVTTGQATEFPCKRALRTYAVEVEDGKVFGLIN